MKLHQIDVVGLQTLERLIDLLGRRLARAAVDFRHQKYFVAITVFQSVSHSPFALTVVVVPRVIEERDAAIDTGADNSRGFIGVFHAADVETADADERYLNAGASQFAVKHFAAAGGSRRLERRCPRWAGWGRLLSDCRSGQAGCCENRSALEKFATGGWHRILLSRAALGRCAASKGACSKCNTCASERRSSCEVP